MHPCPTLIPIVTLIPIPELLCLLQIQWFPLLLARWSSLVQFRHKMHRFWSAKSRLYCLSFTFAVSQVLYVTFPVQLWFAQRNVCLGKLPYSQFFFQCNINLIV